MSSESPSQSGAYTSNSPLVIRRDESPAAAPEGNQGEGVYQGVAEHRMRRRAIREPDTDVESRRSAPLRQKFHADLIELDQTPRHRSAQRAKRSDDEATRPVVGAGAGREGHRRESIAAGDSEIELRMIRGRPIACGADAVVAGIDDHRPGVAFGVHVRRAGAEGIVSFAYRSVASLVNGSIV